jgi:Tol biopolymer transport system component
MRISIIAIALLFILVSCTSTPVNNPSAQATISPPTSEPTSSRTPISTPTQAVTHTPSNRETTTTLLKEIEATEIILTEASTNATKTILALTPSRTPGRSPTPTPSPPPKIPIEGLASLVYEINYDLMQVDINGNISKIPSNISPNQLMAIGDDNATCSSSGEIFITYLDTGEVVNITNTPDRYSSNPVWSQDSKSIYYLEQNENYVPDIWSVNIESGTRHNLSNTPVRVESIIQLWESNPDTLVFYSWPVDDDFSPGEGWIGFLTIMKTDGAQYTVISDGYLSEPAALSPNGKYIAYSDYPINGDYNLSRWIYQNGVGKWEFRPQDYGIQQDGTLSVHSPSWSPDGSRVVWWLNVFESEPSYEALFSGIGIFNIPESTSVIISDASYSSLGYNPAPQWSPDGKWIVYWSGDQFKNRLGLWIARTNGEEIRLVAEFDGFTYDHAVWSPDGQIIAFENPEDGEIWLYEMETGELSPSALPSSISIISWENIKPFNIGDSYIITLKGANLNLRDLPSLSGEILKKLQPGDEIILVDGPQNSDGYTWWKVRLVTDSTEGWVVEVKDWYAPK